jgi:hypothetical protein
VVGRATDDGKLLVEDSLLRDKPIDLPIAVLLGKPPRMTREASRVPPEGAPFATEQIHLAEAVRRVLRLPAVADKTFLITIGDRTVGGLVARDQMVGPWQVPVADAAVTTTSFDVTTGEAMAMGERAPVALLDAAAVGAAGDRRGDHQHRVRADRVAGRHQAVGELDGGGRAPRRGRAPLRRRAARPASSWRRRWGSRSRSARIRCRCTPPGRIGAKAAASPRRCRWW